MILIRRRKREEEICEKLLNARDIHEQAEILAREMKTKAAKIILSREFINALVKTEEFRECEKRAKEVHEKFPIVFCLFYVTARLGPARLGALLALTDTKPAKTDVINFARDNRLYKRLVDVCAKKLGVY